MVFTMRGWRSTIVTQVVIESIVFSIMNSRHILETFTLLRNISLSIGDTVWRGDGDPQWEKK